MNRAQFLLTKLAEESAEVVHIALKTQQFGFNEVCPDQSYTNAQRVHQEIDDLFAIVEMLNEECGFGYRQSRTRITEKKKKVQKYSEYSEHLGLIGKQP
jgi:hypothetical protein